MPKVQLKKSGTLIYDNIYNDSDLNFGKAGW
jgi:hypothetical protein